MCPECASHRPLPQRPLVSGRGIPGFVTAPSVLGSLGPEPLVPPCNGLGRWLAGVDGLGLGLLTRAIVLHLIRIPEVLTFDEVNELPQFCLSFMQLGCSCGIGCTRRDKDSLIADSGRAASGSLRDLTQFCIGSGKLCPELPF
jgi:hypothetical protein